jgi:hypothetical protein
VLVFEGLRVDKKFLGGMREEKEKKVRGRRGR